MNAAEVLAKVMGEHRWPGEILTSLGEAWFTCACGDRFDIPVRDGKIKNGDVTALYDGHLAAAQVAALEAEVREVRDRDLADYLDQMDRAGGGIWTPDFRDGFRHAPFMRCECGKLHLRAYVGPNTACACGRPLYPKAWGR